MKKLLALSVLLSVCAAFAAADFSITGAADMVVMPLQIVTKDGDANKDNVYVGAGLGRDAAGYGPRSRLFASGDFDKKVGYKTELRFFYSHNTLEFGDYLGIWWQPIEQVRFDVGRFIVDDLRGKIGAPWMAHYTVQVDSDEEDAIFRRFKGAVGVNVKVTPIEGLILDVLVPSFEPFASKTDAGVYLTNGAEDLNGGSGDANRALRVYERTQVAIGYTIDGVGLARAQFVGANGAITVPDIDSNGELIYGGTAPYFQAAFAYLGMEGLVIDFGLTGYVPIKDVLTNTWDGKEYTQLEKTGTYWGGMRVALGANYTSGNLGIAGRVDAKFLANYSAAKDDNSGQFFNGQEGKFNEPFVLNAHLWPTYNLGIAIVGLDVGFKYQGKTSIEVNGTSTEDEKSDRTYFGIGLWLQKNIGGATIRGGLAYSIGTDKDHTPIQPAVFSIPINLQMSF